MGETDVDVKSPGGQLTYTVSDILEVVGLSDLQVRDRGRHLRVGDQ